MKTCMRKISIFAALLSPMTCIADGYSEIYGHTKSGLTIVIFEEGRDTSDIAIWDGKRQIAFYKDEPCTMDRGTSRVVLTCAANGRSPVAGAMYLEKPTKARCPKPEFVYSCISGCRKGSETPHRLERLPWEC